MLIFAKCSLQTEYEERRDEIMFRNENNFLSLPLLCMEMEDEMGKAKRRWTRARIRPFLSFFLTSNPILYHPLDVWSTELRLWGPSCYSHISYAYTYGHIIICPFQILDLFWQKWNLSKYSSVARRLKWNTRISSNMYNKCILSLILCELQRAESSRPKKTSSLANSAVGFL